MVDCADERKNNQVCYMLIFCIYALALNLQSVFPLQDSFIKKTKCHGAGTASQLFGFIKRP